LPKTIPAPPFFIIGILAGSPLLLGLFANNITYTGSGYALPQMPMIFFVHLVLV
jgi:hypothetical protein